MGEGERRPSSASKKKKKKKKKGGKGSTISDGGEKGEIGRASTSKRKSVGLLLNRGKRKMVYLKCHRQRKKERYLLQAIFPPHRETSSSRVLGGREGALRTILAARFGLPGRRKGEKDVCPQPVSAKTTHIPSSRRQGSRRTPAQTREKKRASQMFLYLEKASLPGRKKKKSDQSMTT